MAERCADRATPPRRRRREPREHCALANLKAESSMTYRPTAGRVLTLACIVCATPYTFATKSRGRYPRFCSEVCKRARLDNYAERYALSCATCGGEFKSSSLRQSNCSPECRPQVQRRRSDEERLASRRMASHRRRARKRAALVEQFDPLEIYERDKWTCGICHRPVDPTEKRPSHYSPSLDHIKPLARGGLHCRANVQLAHWICNSRKTFTTMDGTRPRKSEIDAAHLSRIGEGAAHTDPGGGSNV